MRLCSRHNSASEVSSPLPMIGSSSVWTMSGLGVIGGIVEQHMLHMIGIQDDMDLEARMLRLR
jgi:hypothetical protein